MARGLRRYDLNPADFDAVSRLGVNSVSFRARVLNEYCSVRFGVGGAPPHPAGFGSRKAYFAR